MQQKISLEDIRGLLASPELARIQDRIVEANGAEVLASERAMAFWGEVSAANITRDEILEILTLYSNQFVEFGQKIQELDDVNEEEYAEGEEPTVDERPQNVRFLGFESGFGLRARAKTNSDFLAERWCSSKWVESHGDRD